MTRSYTTEYDDFKQFLRDAVKKRSRMKNSRNLFKEAEIQYLTIDLDA
jgi:hypothetical protein